MVRFLLLVFIFTTFFPPAYEVQAQDISNINAKHNELTVIKTEISSLEKEISSKSKKEKESYNILQKYDKQNYLLNRIVTNYRAELRKKEKEINSTEMRVNTLSKEINRLQTNYAKYVKAVYQQKDRSDIAAIFDSESISQALRRLFYLKKFSERREGDLKLLERNKSELTFAKIKLEKEKHEKFVLITEKLKEEKVLNQKSLERKKILNAIKKDKLVLKDELAAKKKAEVTVRKLIARLNEKKAKRDAELKAKLKLLEEKKLAESIKNKKPIVKESKLPNKKISIGKPVSNDLTSFQQLKGNLIWPVNEGRIIRKYGEHRNLVLNTITLNYGVDIKIKSDFRAKAVSKGRISAIEWIPGYGSIIIISHSDNYRTVYSHLDEIFVQEGDEVVTGQVIASVGESIEGNVLHFEIWNSRENQNPEIWLVKK